MEKISGVGEAKLKRYGEDFIREIKQYRNENPGISVAEKEAAASSLAGAVHKRKKGETFEETHAFFKGGMSPDDIAKLRSLTPSTIASHLERLIMEGRDIDMDRLVDSARRMEIEKYYLSVKGQDLNSVVEHFNGTVSFEEARLVRANLLRKRQAY